jgi:hypothetical protein
MFKRTILAAVAATALVVGVQAQEGMTIVLRSGDKVTGQLVDMGGAGFAVRVNGQDRNIGTNDVAVIDFTGGGDLSDADWAKAGSGQTVLLRNGQAIKGQLYDIGGTTPLRITLKTDSGDRELSSSEIARIVLARPANAVAATTGNANSPGVPEGQGIAVSGTQAWTPTGIAVRKGDVVTFSATGEVRMSTDAADIATPTGARSQRMSQNAPLPNTSAGALIGRVANSAPFQIGERQTVTMPANGQLFLGINDDHVGDNQGGYRVVIQRQSRQ